MKRMIGAFAVLSVVSALFAFSPKNDNYCYYKINASNVCAFVDYSVTNTVTSGTGTEDIKDIPAEGCESTLTGTQVCKKNVSESFD